MSGLIDVSVRAWYVGPKAEYFRDWPGHAIKLLREDLSTLKIPLPKAENVTVTMLQNGAAQCHFNWLDVPRDGTLHNQLKKSVCPNKEAFREVSRTLSMSRVTFRELDSKQRHPTQRRQGGPPNYQTMPGSSRSHAQLASQRPLEVPGSQSTSRIVARGPSHRTIRPQTEKISQPAGRRPKPEPIEVPVPPVTNREDSVASSVPSLPPPSPQKIDPLPGDKMQNQSETMTSIVTRPSIHPSPPNTLLSPMPIPSATSASPPPGLHLIAKPKQAQPSPQPPADPANSTAAENPTAQEAQISLKRSRSPSPAGVESHPLQRRPPPNPTNLPQIQKLTRELWDLRRHLAANLARESAIIKELDELNSVFVPQASRLTVNESLNKSPVANDKGDGNDTGNGEDHSIKTRLQIVERELQDERTRRIRIEEALNDIQRECREPFVVPALFEAFFMISNVTSQVMSAND